MVTLSILTEVTRRMSGIYGGRPEGCLRLQFTMRIVIIIVVVNSKGKVVFAIKTPGLNPPGGNKLQKKERS